MISIDVVSECSLWSKKIKKKKIFFNSLVSFFPKKYRFTNKKISLTILLSNNKNIRKLNKKFRNKNKHTDILSFPFDQSLNKLKEIYLGDIIISFDHINKPKNLSNKEFKEKTIKIFIHGFLHLLGYNHINYKDYKKMLKEEKLVYYSVTSKLNQFE